MPATLLDLPEDINSRLNTLASRTGRSMESYIIEAITEHLCDLEDAYEAELILSRVKAGEEETYSMAEVEKMLAIVERWPELEYGEQ